MLLGDAAAATKAGVISSNVACAVVLDRRSLDRHGQHEPRGLDSGKFIQPVTVTFFPSVPAEPQNVLLRLLFRFVFSWVNATYVSLSISTA